MAISTMTNATKMMEKTNGWQQGGGKVVEAKRRIHMQQSH
jgi:hypothetical protein